MVSRKYFVLINPTAGKGRFNKHFERIKQEFADRNIPYTTFLTHKEKRGEELVRTQLDESFTDLLILGGDGTINEAINGLKNQNMPISIISMGTGNDSVKNLHQDTAFESQLRTAFDGDPIRVDSGICNGRKFINGVGVGFDGKVVEIMDREGKKFRGHAAYMYTVLKILATYKERPTTFILDDHKIEKPILLLTIAKGTTYGGGFMLNPYANRNDGMLDVCAVGTIPIWLRAYYVPQMKNGNHRKLSMVKFYKSKKVVIHGSKDIIGHMDGELIGNPPFEIDVLPDDLVFRV